jgi:hypothetical protein
MGASFSHEVTLFSSSAWFVPSKFAPRADACDGSVGDSTDRAFSREQLSEFFISIQPLLMAQEARPTYFPREGRSGEMLILHEAVLLGLLSTACSRLVNAGCPAISWRGTPQCDSVADLIERLRQPVRWTLKHPLRAVRRAALRTAEWLVSDPIAK